jgi:pimeloyl-ACP methyl ester carboxylesterase
MARHFLARSGAGRPGRIAGLVLIAPAWDMTEELMWKNASPEIRRAILEDGVWLRPSRYFDGPYPITRSLVEDGRNHLIGLAPWNPGCPVEILHGRLDPDVPFAHAASLAARLIGVPVTLNEVTDGGHRLSRPEDLDLLSRRIGHLLQLYTPPAL